jgi:hypothetical protein
MWMTVALALLQASTLTTIAQGTDSAIAEPREVVARTAEAWQAVWTDHDAGTPPAIDFTQSMVVGVFLGMRPTAGFAVEITAVEMEEGRTIVWYVERRPDPGDLTAQMLTAPFHLVAVPRTDSEVVFRPEPPQTPAP